MSRVQGQSAPIGAPPGVAVGDTLLNGTNLGGARIYPIREDLIRPTAQYTQYIGSAGGIPQTPPVAGLTSTAGIADGSRSAVDATPSDGAVAAPWGRLSPLPWVIGGLFAAVVAMHLRHYKGL